VTNPSTTESALTKKGGCIKLWSYQTLGAHDMTDSHRSNSCMLRWTSTMTSRQRQPLTERYLSFLSDAVKTAIIRSSVSLGYCRAACWWKNAENWSALAKVGRKV